MRDFGWSISLSPFLYKLSNIQVRTYITVLLPKKSLLNTSALSYFGGIEIELWTFSQYAPSTEHISGMTNGARIRYHLNLHQPPWWFYVCTFAFTVFSDSEAPLACYPSPLLHALPCFKSRHCYILGRACLTSSRYLPSLSHSCYLSFNNQLNVFFKTFLVTALYLLHRCGLQAFTDGKPWLKFIIRPHKVLWKNSYEAYT